MAVALCVRTIDTLCAQQESVKSVCGKNKKNCKNKNNCLCYCSGKCDLREKKPGDKPVYVENDPHGHYCYCNQWDLDVFQENQCDNAPKNTAAIKK